MKQPNRCTGCIYWKKLSSAGFSACACHFLLDTGRRRRKNNKGLCMERQNGE